MKDKILILGAAGFIGTNLSLRLLKEKKNLILFDKDGANFADAVKAQLTQSSIRTGSFTEMSKEDWLTLIPELSEVCEVYHLISTTCHTNSNLDIAKELDENILSTVRFMDACVEAEVEKVVFLSSGGTVYGKEHTGICREEEEGFPITVYGLQKLCIEKILHLYLEMHGIDYRIIRLANPYGPYQRPNGVQGVVTTFTWKMLKGEPIQIYGDGSVIRDYIYIDDAIEGILKVAAGEEPYKIYNLGSGSGFTIKEIVEKIAKVLQKEPVVEYLSGRKVDVPKNVLDISRFRESFGEPCHISMEEGIKLLAEFFEK